ncbi:MAG: response regulator [Pirellulaceae bacterium]
MQTHQQRFRISPSVEGGLRDGALRDGEKPRRILIVDDDKDILTNLADILTDKGYEPITVNDSREALDLVQKSDPADRAFDLCLLDFKMPGMDGLGLYEKIKSIVPSLRVIMITAYAGEDGVDRAKNAGTWRILRKPVDVPQLLGMINDAVA